jgi:hypothetical protein
MCSGTLAKLPCGKLVLGCFFGLGFVVSVGCVSKSAGKCGEVKKVLKSEIMGYFGK